MLAASAEDGGHCAPMANHVFVRDGEIVGAAAILASVFTFWAHSKKLRARESFDLIARTKVMCGGFGTHLTACATNSPFFPLMERLGYRRLGAADFFEPA